MTAGREKVAADPATARFSFVDLVMQLLDEKRAEDIVWLDISEVTSLADDFVIATVLNPRQADAVVGALEKERKKRDLPRLGIDGRGSSGWVVLDYGDLIVHVMTADQREYYGLEYLWSDAKRVR
ncbi:MAG: ribosome silencing factor [Planctomycetota bacterium]|nr:ribosome silencing factor [Planctomycetota bacterium]